MFALIVYGIIPTVLYFPCKLYDGKKEVIELEGSRKKLFKGKIQGETLSLVGALISGFAIILGIFVHDIKISFPGVILFSVSCGFILSFSKRSSCVSKD